MPDQKHGGLEPGRPQFTWVRCMRRGLSPFLSPTSAVSQQPSVGQQQGSWARAASARAGYTGRRVPVSFNVALSSSVTPSVRATPRTPTDDWAGRRCYFGPFAGDEHHQVRPPLGLLFLLCETVRPSPNISIRIRIWRVRHRGAAALPVARPGGCGEGCIGEEEGEDQEDELVHVGSCQFTVLVVVSDSSLLATGSSSALIACLASDIRLQPATGERDERDSIRVHDVTREEREEEETGTG